MYHYFRVEKSIRHIFRVPRNYKGSGYTTISLDANVEFFDHREKWCRTGNTYGTYTHGNRIIISVSEKEAFLELL